MSKPMSPRRYGDFGVPEYWVADPKEQAVWVWRFARGGREPERVAGRLAWQPSPEAPPLELATGELFRPL